MRNIRLSENIYRLWLLLVCSALFQSLSSFAEVTTERTLSLTLPIEHAFGDGEFTPRGKLAFKSFKTAEAAMINQVTLTPEQLGQLESLPSIGGYYRVRVPVSVGNTQKTYVSSSAKACAIYRLNSTDEIAIRTDGISKVLSIAIIPNPPYCDNNEFEQDRQFASKFKTTAIVQYPHMAPSPVTQDYIKMLEEQKRAEAGTGKEKSFLAKYWMYIIPGIIFLMLFSQDTPQQGGGGGGSS